MNCKFCNKQLYWLPSSDIFSCYSDEYNDDGHYYSLSLHNNAPYYEELKAVDGETNRVYIVNLDFTLKRTLLSLHTGANVVISCVAINSLIEFNKMSCADFINKFQKLSVLL